MPMSLQLALRTYVKNNGFPFISLFYNVLYVFVYLLTSINEYYSEEMCKEFWLQNEIKKILLHTQNHFSYLFAQNNIMHFFVTYISLENQIINYWFTITSYTYTKGNVVRLHLHIPGRRCGINMRARWLSS